MLKTLGAAIEQLEEEVRTLFARVVAAELADRRATVLLVRKLRAQRYVGEKSRLLKFRVGMC